MRFLLPQRHIALPAFWHSIADLGREALGHAQKKRQNPAELERQILVFELRALRCTSHGTGHEPSFSALRLAEPSCDAACGHAADLRRLEEMYLVEKRRARKLLCGTFCVRQKDMGMRCRSLPERSCTSRNARNKLRQRIFPLAPVRGEASKLAGARRCRTHSKSSSLKRPYPERTYIQPAVRNTGPDASLPQQHFPEERHICLSYLRQKSRFPGKRG